MPSLIFTDSAATKVHELISEEGNFALKLRVYVKGGGCSGFQYVFTFAEIVNDDDFVIEKMINGISIQLLVDAVSYPYLEQAEIDYESGLNGEQFIIRNLKAKTTCGCGSSFDI